MADVFISYSRRDQDFVRRLHAALEAAGRDAWVDWEGIPPTAKWMDEVRAAIDTANAFVFVVSPDSADSPVCRQEAEHAATSGKRIVPIVWRDVPNGHLPEAVSAHNWLLMRETDDFDAGVVTLLAALDTDLEWVHAHTRLVTRAREWEANRRERSYLLRGRDLDAAERQLASGEHRNPSPTPLQTEYVFASRRAERRGQRIRSLALSGGLVAALVLAGFALLQLQEAITQRTRADQNADQANTQRQVAEANASAAVQQQQLAQANATDANTQRQVAQANATDANTQRQVAQANATDANTQRQVAAQQANLAHARELAAAANASLTKDPELSVLLATKAVQTLADTNTDRALRQALSTSRIRARYVGHTADVYSISLSKDGRLLASASADNTVRVWDTTTHQSLTVISLPAIPVSVSISGLGDQVAIGEVDGSVSIRSTADGSEVKTFVADPAGVAAVAFSPDGSRLVTGSYGGATEVWNTATWTQVVSVPAVPESSQGVSSVAFSPDGTEFVTGGNDRIGYVWDAATGKQLLRLVGHVRQIFGVAWSSDGARIATASFDGTGRIWDARSGATTSVLRGHTDGVNAVAFSPDSKSVATTSNDGSVRTWDASTGLQLATFTGHNGGIDDVRFTPDGVQLISAGSDRTIREWAVDSSRPQLTLSGQVGSILDGEYSPDGTRIVTASGDWTAIVYDAATGTNQLTLRGHTNLILSASFSPDGSRIVTASGDNTAKIWDATSGAVLTTLNGNQGFVNSASYDPSGTRIVTSSDDGTVRIWNASTGEQQLLISIGTRSESAVFLASGSKVAAADDNGAITIWDATTGAKIDTLTGHTGSVIWLSASTDGSQLASAATDSSIRIWDLANDRVIRELHGSFSYAWKARFSPDGRLIVSGGDDGAAHVWDTQTGELLADIPSDPRDVISAAFSVDGSQLLLTNRGGNAKIFACDLCGPTGDVLALASTRVTRDFTADERAALLHETSTPEPTPSPAPSPTAEPSPGPSPSEPPPTEPPPTMAPDDICLIFSGGCDLTAGTYRPSRFEPQLAFRLDRALGSLGQSRNLILLTLPESGDEIFMADAHSLYGNKDGTAFTLTATVDGVLGFLRDQAWMKLSTPQALTVGGRSAIQLDVTSEISDQLAWLLTDFGTDSWVPGEHLRIVLADAPGTCLVLIGEHVSPDSADTFDRFFDSVTQTITFSP